ncbi:DNA topoisomerase 3-alpha-like [Uloborus diversus]|uniref:DNA topoisomerase 3-alpha-like n=1 Tax=Uloborus diversus TaxID=327109 RepID=UPI00240A63B3|nr:DNA topoisomerase 3-alpha-like [Uloborus diversus]
MVRVLNVAEKNDAAKNIADIMSNGRFRRRDGRSVYNKIYEFEYNLFNQRCQMVMTSVSGHLLNLEFTGSYKSWQSCNPLALFEAPVIMECPQDYQAIKVTLEAEVRSCQYLVIWTDGDREGENIGFEIIEVCKKVKPNLTVYRAKFSEITSHAISRACANLCAPDKLMSDAVNVRRELDLRIGAAFTRFQTLRLKKVFPNILSNQLISYGSCQFPTLGFVVERYKQVQSFIPEAFWKLKVSHVKEDINTEFSWKRGRLFDHTACLVLYQMCLERPTALVVDVRSRNKSKWRPQPLDTVEFEKLASRKLHINAKTAMTVAEKLYTKGFISYPRTETTIFPKELNLIPLVEMQCEDPNWGAFAQRVLEEGPNPRQGNKTDNAHPPIHPTKYINTLQGNEKTVYELVVRHFLACVSKDAEGRETTVEIDVNNERFAVNGLIIIARNYLEVYPYERWNAKIIGHYELNENFQPTSIEMSESETSAPELLTEADLIGLMEKHGIGTDATHAEHIETIKSRLYVGLNESNRFIPGELGMGLVEGYDLMGFHMSKPHLRAELEADLKRITEGTKDPNVVLREQIAKYKECFIEVIRQASKLDTALATYFDVTPDQIVEDNIVPQTMPVMKCPKCQTGDIVLRTKNEKFFLSCMSFPACNAAMWLPKILEQVTVLDEECEDCRPRSVKKMKFKFKTGSLLPFFPDNFENCLGGCDSEFLEIIGCRAITPAIISSNNSAPQSVTNRNASSDSGYESSNRSTASRYDSSLSSSSTHSTNFQSNRPSFANVSHNNTSRPSTNRTFTSNQNNSGATNDIVCGCGKKAIILTVRKEGPNKGRQFYKCPEMSDDVKCNFFLWKDEEDTSPAQNFSSIIPSNQQNSFRNGRHPNAADSSDTPTCRCPLEAKKLTVMKDGDNKGRHFYACPKPRGQGCGFFQWADENANSSSFGQPSTSMNGGANGSRRRPSDSNTAGPSSKRKCGICSQTGHNRKKCPQNR